MSPGKLSQFFPFVFSFHFEVGLVGEMERKWRILDLGRWLEYEEKRDSKE